MIRARVERGGAFFHSLADKAARLAGVHAEDRKRRGDPWRWRRAALLWPLFAKDDR